MPLLNDECDNCHTPILGRKKSLFFHKGYGYIGSNSLGEHCTTNERTRKVDKGKMIVHIKEEQTVARCPCCGRKEKSGWIEKSQDKKWKDEGCE